MFDANLSDRGRPRRTSQAYPILAFQGYDRHAASSLLRATSVAVLWLLLGLRAGGRGAGARLRSRDCLLEGEAGAGVRHRRAPGVDGRDDLFGVDPLEVGAGR